MWQIFRIFLRLGLTSFGGPVAHLAYFRDEFVQRRQWFDDRHYADLVALCQALPGPASSQVGMAIGWQRGGFAGALAAWTAFTLPSALVLALAALGVAALPEAPWRDGLLHGLKLAALVVVVQAVWQMGRNLCPDRPRQTLALAAGAVLLWAPAWVPGVAAQVGLIGLGAVVGIGLWRAGEAMVSDSATAAATASSPPALHGRRTALACLITLAALLLLLPFTRAWGELWVLLDSFFRTGALVFGGGHVVLPLLEAEVVQTGWVSQDSFLAGYGLAQAVPGPLFTFAAFLGTDAAGWSGGLVALVAIFLPSFLLVGGLLPLWAGWRERPAVRAGLDGVNAVVVGLLLAALLGPVQQAAITGPGDFPWIVLGALALMVWRCPPWLLVLAGGALGAGLTLL